MISEAQGHVRASGAYRVEQSRGSARESDGARPLHPASGGSASGGAGFATSHPDREVLECGLASPMEEGTPQGGPLSLFNRLIRERQLPFDQLITCAVLQIGRFGLGNCRRLRRSDTLSGFGRPSLPHRTGFSPIKHRELAPTFVILHGSQAGARCHIHRGLSCATPR
jgi:hypothetical protein